MLTDRWEKRRQFCKGSAALCALALLPHYSALTTKRLATLLRVSVRAATTAIEQLMDVGILNERTGYTRNRIFVAMAALHIINHPFGAEPIVPDQ